MIANNGDIHGPDTSSASGGAALALDGSSLKDQAMVRTAIKRWPRRWEGVDLETKRAFVAGMKAAHAKAVVLLDAPEPDMALKAVQAIGSILKTAVAMEGQVQADEHLEDKNSRLDGGQATENVVHMIPAPTRARVGD